MQGGSNEATGRIFLRAGATAATGAFEVMATARSPEDAGVEVSVARATIEVRPQPFLGLPAPGAAAVLLAVLAARSFSTSKVRR